MSLFLISRIRSVFDPFVAYLAMAPAFAMLTNAAVANIVGLWFTKKRGLAMSVALTGGGVGGMVIVPTLVWLSSQLSFPIALEVIAAVTIPVLLIAIAICIRIPTWEEAKTAEPGGAQGAKTQTLTRRQASGCRKKVACQRINWPTIRAPAWISPSFQANKAEKKMPRSHPCIKSASSADGSDVSTYPNVPLSLTSRAARTSPPIAAR